MTERKSWLASVWILACLAGVGGAQPEGEVVAIRAGKVLTMDAEDRVLNNAVILIRDGVIEALGPAREIEIPAGARVIDARDKWVAPGFVDCHNHTAGSLSDLNDGVFLTNPGLRTVDTLDPDSEDLRDARSGGVTTVLLIPGSGNNMSGFGTVVRTAGATAEDMVVRAPGSLKIAQAGNPERYWFGVGRAYMNWNLRATLERAEAYHHAWLAWEERLAEDGREAAGAPPERNLVWDEFRGLFAQEFPASVHTQIYQVVLNTIVMLHDRFGLRVMLDHSTFDGFKTASLVVERDLDTIVGPRQYYFDRAERRIDGVAHRWYQGGVRRLGLNTDAPVIPEEELFLQGSLGVRFGLDHYVALKALTIVPAQALQIDDRVGSIEVGKDADLGIWTGDPIDPRRWCWKTLIQGEVVYDATQGRRF